MRWMCNEPFVIDLEAGGPLALGVGRPWHHRHQSTDDPPDRTLRHVVAVADGRGRLLGVPQSTAEVRLCPRAQTRTSQRAASSLSPRTTALEVSDRGRPDGASIQTSTGTG